MPNPTHPDAPEEINWQTLGEILAGYPRLDKRLFTEEQLPAIRAHYAAQLRRGILGDDPAYICTHCGYHPKNRAGWCELGCGSDYNEMIPVRRKAVHIITAQERERMREALESIPAHEWAQALAGWVPRKALAFRSDALAALDAAKGEGGGTR